MFGFQKVQSSYKFLVRMSLKSELFVWILDTCEMSKIQTLLFGFQTSGFQTSGFPDIWVSDIWFQIADTCEMPKICTLVRISDI